MLVERIDVVECGALVLVAIEGSHFLWKMVRRIVGVLVEVGKGDMEIAATERLLTSASDSAARFTAPASGLFLERVYYTGDQRTTEPRAASTTWNF